MTSWDGAGAGEEEEEEDWDEEMEMKMERLKKESTMTTVEKLAGTFGNNGEKDED